MAAALRKPLLAGEGRPSPFLVLPQEAGNSGGFGRLFALEVPAFLFEHLS